MTQFKTFPLMLLIGLISLCSCDSCSDEIDTTVLPPETQSGENTFGCYVNSELLVHNRKGRIIATYNRQNKMLSIESYLSNGETIYLKDSIILLNQKEKIRYADYSSFGTLDDCIYYSGVNVGEITVTKFDTINKIVSGRFEFPGQCSDSNYNSLGDSIVYITDGRFDIWLNIK